MKTVHFNRFSVFPLPCTYFLDKNFICKDVFNMSNCYLVNVIYCQVIACYSSMCRCFIKTQNPKELNSVRKGNYLPDGMFRHRMMKGQLKLGIKQPGLFQASKQGLLRAS